MTSASTFRRRRTLVVLVVAVVLGLLALMLSRCGGDPLDRIDDQSRKATGMDTFSATDGANGMVRPQSAWVRKHITSQRVPLLGTVKCNKAMLPPLAAALTEVQVAGLSSLIDASQYGGCYVPRYIDRKKSAGLSMHAYGTAIDLNVSTNHLGTKGSMDPRVVRIFTKWGFEWGGGWKRPDPMHFELIGPPAQTG